MKSINSDSGNRYKEKKQRLFYCFTGIGIPCFLIVCTEVFLRLFNVGYDSHFFLHVKDHGNAYCIDNPLFGSRFFPPTLVRASEKFRFSEKKNKNTQRIFILGSSAAQGEPAPAFGFSRQLDLLLKERYENLQCEIINTGTTAINSHVIVPIARECSRLSPDIFIVYTGNNEVIGPFGPGTVFSRFSNLWLIRLRIFLSSTRLGQFTSTLSASLTKSNVVPTGWGGMKMFLQHKIRFDDPMIAGVNRHYRENLRDICKAARRCGARVVLCTVASNIKDCPPFFSMHRTQCSADSIALWNSLFQQSITLQEQGQYLDALNGFKKAAAIDSTYAELHYRMGKCLNVLGQHTLARLHYIAARDYDALRFRANTSLNSVVRNVVEEFKDCAVLFDIEKFLAALSEHGMCGEEAFLEHVHFNFHGNYQFAISLLPVLDSLFGKSVAVQNALSEDACRKRLAFTPHEELQINLEIVKRLTKPPFANNEDNQQMTFEYKKKIEYLTKYVKEDSGQVNINAYRYALTQDSIDTYILGLYGSYLLLNNSNAVESEDIFRKVVDLMPQNEYALHNLAIALEQQGKIDDAVTYYRKATKINPLFFDSYIRLSDNLIRLSRIDEARRSLDKVLKINPELPSALQRYAQIMILRGKAITDPHFFEKNTIYRMALAAYYNAEGKKLQNSGDIVTALQKYQSAIQIYPQSGELHENLGRALMNAGRISDGITHYKIAINLDSARPSLRINFGDALAMQGLVDDAEKQYLVALTLDSTLISARNRLGILYFNQSRYALALSQFIEVAQQQPSELAVHKNIIRVSSCLNKKSEAIALFERLLKTYPQNAELHYSLGNLMLELGEVKGAQEHLRVAAQLRPELSNVRSDL